MEKAARRKKGRLSGSAFLVGCHSSLVVQLQRELDLSRIVGSIARGSNGAKRPRAKGSVSVRREVERPGNCAHPVAGEFGRVEVRVVENVEELSAKLEPETLAKLEVLECREVQPFETRSS